MSLEAALRLRLLDGEAVLALVGTHPTDGAPSVDWDVRRQGSPLPGLVLQVISDPRPQTHDGFDSIRPTRLQVSAQAADKTTAAALREAAIAALVPAGTFHGVQFDRAGIEMVRSRQLPTDTGIVFREETDFIIWHKA